MQQQIIREKRRHVPIQEEKEKGIHLYMKYRRQKLILRGYAKQKRKWDLSQKEVPPPSDPSYYLNLTHPPKTTEEIMKVKGERRKLKQQVLDIINDGVINALKEVKKLCSPYRREYISNSVLTMLEEDAVVMIKNVDPE